VCVCECVCVCVCMPCSVHGVLEMLMGYGDTHMAVSDVGYFR
jgi:hypothetical protein